MGSSRMRNGVELNARLTKRRIKMKSSIVSLALIALLVSAIGVTLTFAQSAGDYRSTTSGNWSSASPSVNYTCKALFLHAK